MQLTVPRPRRTARKTAPPAVTVHSHARAKREGGPVDRALYSCSCGHAFMAPVTTSVGCPHCGQMQAW